MTFMKRLTLDRGWGPIRVARDHYPYRGRAFVHCHDFSEVFWIEAGEGHHIINGKRLPLSPGDLVMIRPDDSHDLVARSNEGITFVNVSFPSSTVNFFKRRYFKHTTSFWGGDGRLPSCYKLSISDVRHLGTEADGLAGGPQELFQSERFLLNLLQTLSLTSVDGKHANVPGWLRDACEQIRSPEHFSGGTRQLSRLAGRCPEHVARTAKQTLGKTPTQIVNEARLDYAAAQLSMSSKEIIDICLDCGFKGLTHFYKLFRTHFDMSPRHYRLYQQLRLR
ncbi:AraC family transcriptional regulator [Verrucomicrobiota bacterium]